MKNLNKTLPSQAKPSLILILLLQCHLNFFCVCVIFSFVKLSAERDEYDDGVDGNDLFNFFRFHKIIKNK